MVCRRERWTHMQGINAAMAMPKLNTTQPVDLCRTFCGSSVATLSLSLRSMKGRSTACSLQHHAFSTGTASVEVIPEIKTSVVSEGTDAGSHKHPEVSCFAACSDRRAENTSWLHQTCVLNHVFVSPSTRAHVCDQQVLLLVEHGGLSSRAGSRRSSRPGSPAGRRNQEGRQAHGVGPGGSTNYAQTQQQTRQTCRTGGTRQAETAQYGAENYCQMSSNQPPYVWYCRCMCHRSVDGLQS
jgi:hypothetical protein